MERVEVYFSLGSNLGEREVNLMRAVNLMDQAFGTHPERISGIIETEALGFDGPSFLNMCLLYRLPRKGTPEEHVSEVFHAVKDIEKALGREDAPEYDAAGKRIYHNRTIDIDILFYGNQTINTKELTIPHPRVGERDFVKIPLREIAKPVLKSAFPDYFD